MVNHPKGILIISGTLGAGKTTVAIEIGRQLELSHLPCAVIDLDWLNWVCLDNDFDDYDCLAIKNLLSIWPNFRALGVTYLILARALIHSKPIEMLKSAWPETSCKVVQLLASPDTIRARLRNREAGFTLREHLDEVNAITAKLDAVKLEQFTVTNENRSIAEVAREVIYVTGWNSRRNSGLPID